LLTYIKIIRGRVLQTQAKRLEWLAARRLENAMDVADADCSNPPQKNWEIQ